MEISALQKIAKDNKISCGECKYSEVEERDDGFRLDDVLVCSRECFDQIEPDFFCAGFERKEDERD